MHCFNIPLAVLDFGGVHERRNLKNWNETAYVDGYSFPRFFCENIFYPQLHSGVGVTAFLLLHVFMG